MARTSIQFWVSPTEKKIIYKNMKRNGMRNMSDFLRILALSDIRIKYRVEPREVLHVSEAHLGHISTEGREQKRANG